MKKLIGILIGSVAILAALIGYNLWLQNDYSNTVDNQTAVTSDTVLPTTEVIEAYTPTSAPVPSMEVVAEEVELTEDEESQIEETQDLAATDVTVTHSGFEYAYNQLSDGDKSVYDVIYQAIVGYEENAPLPTLDLKQIDRAFNAVINDHPEIFYIDGYKYTQYSRNGVTRRIAFNATYNYSKEERDSIWTDLDSVANGIVASAPSGDDYTRVKYVFDTIVNSTEYNLSAADNQNIISVLINHSSVCNGYAKTMQLLLNRMGIDTTLVTGSVSSGEGHAWNLVKADGDWYYVDSTWGDASYEFVESSGDNTRISGTNYDYLMATDADMSSTHYASMSYSLPSCTAIADNYFVREGLYFTEYNADQLQNAFNNTINSGASSVKLKAADASVYQTLKTELMDNQHIFDYLGSSKQVRYSENASTRTLTFWL